MKLKKLIIQGFKSFKDRTIINFDNGITGIVGPNGCGKSNIVDALFWVMGEQSAKHLRGSKMKDLIFSGSTKYSPGAFSEATLVLDNEDGKHIHIGNKVAAPTEIQLTRKLYRNGETEYRINGEPARLRDIQEVFMDTGAGAKSYSIIAQGEINRLVQAKPEERRSMIEDVAGITKFKVRKRESMRKIEATQLNLSRLSDLQIEIEKNLKALQKQAEKAEKARNLKEKIKNNDIIVHSHKVFEGLKSFREGEIFLNGLEIDLETKKTRKNSLEVSLSDERLQKELQNNKIEELQKEYNELSRFLAASEEKLNFLCQSLTDKEKLTESREVELKEIDEEVEKINQKQEVVLSELNELEKQRAEGFDFSDLEEIVDDLKENLQDKSDQLEQTIDEQKSLKKEYDNHYQNLYRNKSRLEELANSLQDITQEIEALEEQYSGVNKEIATERESAIEAEKKVEGLKLEEEKLKSEIEDHKEVLGKKEQELREKQKILIQSESMLSSLIEIRSSSNENKEGTSKLVKEDPKDLKIFGSLLKCKEDYSDGIQSLLKSLLNVAVSTGEVTKEDLLEKVLELKDKGVSLLIPQRGTKTSSETLERLKLKFNDILPISELLEISEDIREALLPLLEGYYLTNQITKEKINTLDSSMSFKGISSFDGLIKVENIDGGLVLDFSNPDEEKNSVIERNNKIEELTTEVSRLKEEVPALEEDHSLFKGKLDILLVEYEKTRETLSDEKSNAAVKASALEGRLANIEAGQTRLEILKNRKVEFSKQRLGIQESEEELSKKVAELSESIENLSEIESGLNESVSILREEYNQKREDLMEKQVEAKSFDQKVESFTAKKEDLEGQKEREIGRKENIKNKIETLASEIEDVTSQISQLEEENLSSAESLQDQKETLGQLKDSFSELLIGMQEREDEVKKLNSEINKLEKDSVEVSARRERVIEEEEQVVRNIFEKYKIDLRQSIGKFLEFEDSDFEGLKDLSSMFIMETLEGIKEIEPRAYEFSRRYGQDLKECETKFKNYKLELNRLGEINWQAIEEYERQKLRFDFLKIQEEELKTSLEDLEKAILHIDEKSKERFKIAFEEVDQRFRKVFPIIFGGGSAQLRVVGDINESECGVEIIAQPPGKKMQNINLMSGGEKAMTAISLIFSIFLVKPSPFCLLDEVDAPLDDANVGRFNELLREMSKESQFILITHNKKTMELNDTLYGVTMQEPGVSKAVSVQLH